MSTVSVTLQEKPANIFRPHTFVVQIAVDGRDAHLADFGTSKLWPALVDDSKAFTPARLEVLSHKNWSDRGNWLCRVLESVFLGAEKKIVHDWLVSADVYKDSKHISVKLCDGFGGGQVGDGGGGGGGLRIEVRPAQGDIATGKKVAEEFAQYLEKCKPNVLSSLDACRAKEFVLTAGRVDSVLETHARP